MKKFAFLLMSAGLTPGALAPLAAAEPRQVISHEKLWMMKRVGAPQLSPDGKWVVYALVEPSYEKDGTVSDLWLVPADGSAVPRRLTSSKAGESSPRWAPDSRRIAFAAKREGDDDAQIYVIDLAGGEARRMTSIPTGAGNPQWRPDGGAILFESNVYPGALDAAANKQAAAERKARKFNMRVYEHFPIRYWNEWLDDRRPALFVQELTEGSVARDILSSTTLARAEGFGGSAQGDGGVSLAPLWSPDGKEVLLTATTERWNAAFARVNFGLYRMPAAGGELVGQVSIPRTAQQFAPVAARIRQTRPDAVYIASFGAQQSQIIKQLRDNGVSQPLVSYSAMNIDSVRATAEAEGLIFTTQSTDFEGGDAVTRRFATDFRARFNSDAGTYQVNYYNAARLFALLAQSLEREGAEVNGDNMRRVLLAQREFDLVGGKGRFDDQGNMSAELQINEIRGGRSVKIG